MSVQDKKKAIGLKYNKQKQNAPKVIAKGSGEKAKKIIDIAKEHNIPIKEDSDLVELLSKVEIDQEIPPTLYKAVAEVFSWLYSINSNQK